MCLARHQQQQVIPIGGFNYRSIIKTKKNVLLEETIKKHSYEFGKDRDSIMMWQFHRCGFFNLNSYLTRHVYNLASLDRISSLRLHM